MFKVYALIAAAALYVPFAAAFLNQAAQMV
jgi:hypothetical protein